MLTDRFFKPAPVTTKLSNRKELKIKGTFTAFARHYKVVEFNDKVHMMKMVPSNVYKRANVKECVLMEVESVNLRNELLALESGTITPENNYVVVKSNREYANAQPFTVIRDNPKSDERGVTMFLRVFSLDGDESAPEDIELTVTKSAVDMSEEGNTRKRSTAWQFPTDKTFCLKHKRVKIQLLAAMFNFEEGDTVRDRKYVITGHLFLKKQPGTGSKPKSLPQPAAPLRLR